MILAQAKTEIIKLLKTASGVKTLNEADLVLPPNLKLGDLSFPCFSLAKVLKNSPQAIAIELHKKIQPTGLIAKTEAAGPYLNFFLNRKEITKSTLNVGRGLVPRRGGEQAPALHGQRIMMEFVSPNNNKPLHLGHLRNAFLGESVARLLESQGAKVIRACLFNDRGLSIAKSMVAYKLWNKGKTPTKIKVKGDKFVGDLYVEFEKKSKDNPQLADEAAKTVVLWEKDDKETKQLWKTLNTWVLGGFAQTLKRSDIKFNLSYFESKLWKQGKKLVEEGIKRKIFTKDKTGAVMANLANFNLPPKVMIRSNGTAIYSTSDLFLGKEKFEKNKLTKAIWCVGSEQDLYLKQLFSIYQSFGFSWAKNCEHLSYGLVFLPEGKMKSREGKVVEADDLLNELYTMVVEEIKVRHKLSATEIKKRAELIAQAALRFYLLSVTPKTIVHFNPKESIAFTGHTGPYLLYTYARIASILKKADKQKLISKSYKLQANDLEWQLIFRLARFPEVVREAALQYDPSHLAQYLYDLAKNFSEFYEAVPVLKAEPQTRAARLNLLRAVQNTMDNGLKLLTIKPIKEM